jgi:hypothetical protein
MKQLSFSDAEYGGKRKRTRREVFLAEMQRAVPWSRLEALIAPHYPKAGGGRRRSTDSRMVINRSASALLKGRQIPSRGAIDE